MKKILFGFLLLLAFSISFAWFSGYNLRTFVNCTQMANGQYAAFNGTQGFSVEASLKLPWGQCQPNSYLYFNGSTTVVYANDTTRFPLDVENDSTNSFNVSAVYNNSVMAVYHLSEGSGDANDSLGLRNLTQSGTVPTVAGYFSQARGNFTASNFFSSSTSAYSITDGSAFSVCGFFKPAAALVPAEADLFHISTGASKFFINLDYNRSGLTNEFAFETWQAGQAVQNAHGASIALNTSHWYFVCGVYNGTATPATINIYVDGVVGTAGANAKVGAIVSNDTWLGAGEAHTNPSNFYIDQFVLYNHSLSTAEITQLYNNSINQTGFANLEASSQLINPFITPGNPDTSSTLNFQVTYNANNQLNITLYNWTVFKNNNSFLNGTTSGVFTSGTTTSLVNLTGFAPLDSVFFTINATFNDNSSSGVFNSSTVVIAADSSTVGACGGSLTNVLLNFTFYDQDNTTALVNSTMSATFFLTSITNSTVNFSFSSVVASPNISICANLTNTYNLSSIQTFTAPGYRTLYYYILNQTVVNGSNFNISLYDINTTGSVLTRYQILQGSNQPVANATLQILRYYPGTNQLLLVSMGRTDENGLTESYAVPNTVNYRYIVVKDAQLLFTSNTAAFPCDPSLTICPIQVFISTGVGNEYTAFVNAVGVGCGNTSTTVFCTSNNPSGTATNLVLKLYQIGAYTNTLVCTNTVNTGSGTAICTIPNASLQYFYIGTSTIGSDIILGQGYINGNAANNFDATLGLIGTFMFIAIGGAFGMAGGFAAAIIGALLGVILSVLLGFFAISLQALVAIVAVGVVLAWVLRQ